MIIKNYRESLAPMIWLFHKMVTPFMLLKFPSIEILSNSTNMMLSMIHQIKGCFEKNIRILINNYTYIKIHQLKKQERKKFMWISMELRESSIAYLKKKIIEKIWQFTSHTHKYIKNSLLVDFHFKMFFQKRTVYFWFVLFKKI